MATTKNTRNTRTRAKASENPTPTRTVKGNGNGGNGKSTTDVPELTAQQRMELDAAKARKGKSPNTGRGRATQYNTRREGPAPVPTLIELLTLRLTGVGKKTAEDALTDAKLDGTKKASREQLNRANVAPNEKAGLKGKALALWVLTGKSNGGIAPATVAQPATTIRSRSSALEGAAGQAKFVEYLNAQVSGDAMAPAENKPTVDENGKLRIKSAHWRQWLASQGVEVGAAAAVKPLRDAGLGQERWFTLPRGQRMCYVGAVPKGTERLPVRKDTPLPGATAPGERRARGSRPFARPSVEQIDVLTNALNAFKPRGAEKLASEQVRDELLNALGAVTR